MSRHASADGCTARLLTRVELRLGLRRAAAWGCVGLQLGLRKVAAPLRRLPLISWEGRPRGATPHVPRPILGARQAHWLCCALRPSRGATAAWGPAGGCGAAVRPRVLSPSLGPSCRPSGPAAWYVVRRATTSATGTAATSRGSPVSSPPPQPTPTAQTCGARGASQPLTHSPHIPHNCTRPSRPRTDLTALTVPDTPWHP